jgi:hypothetical protein
VAAAEQQSSGDSNEKLRFRASRNHNNAFEYETVAHALAGRTADVQLHQQQELGPTRQVRVTKTLLETPAAIDTQKKMVENIYSENMPCTPSVSVVAIAREMKKQQQSGGSSSSSGRKTQGHAPAQAVAALAMALK